MAKFTLELIDDRCAECGKRATHLLRNSEGTAIAMYCTRDGQRALAEKTKAERETAHIKAVTA